MFYKWGQFAYRHRRIIPVVVIAIILLMQVLWGSKLGDRLSQEGRAEMVQGHVGADRDLARAVERPHRLEARLFEEAEDRRRRHVLDDTLVHVLGAQPPPRHPAAPAGRDR